MSRSLSVIKLMASEGAGNAYCKKYFDQDDFLALKVDIIIFTSDVACMFNLEASAQERFYELNDTHRRKLLS